MMLHKSKREGPGWGLQYCFCGDFQVEVISKPLNIQPWRLQLSSGLDIEIWESLAVSILALAVLILRR